MGSGCCPDRPIVKDELCSNWEADCVTGTDNDPVILWEADPDVIQPFGTVTILVENACRDVEIFVNDCERHDTPVVTIDEGQSFSKTFNNLTCVAVRCRQGDDPGTICCGKLCMTVHYKRC
ncbi:DUF3992 domain-containing protein [Bacillus solimangrovi]|uniref:DUF3992 domain-containing protein n=1 Tax=Bacillus solimangrovi TaxID=1305675 RepID=A0A1E5LBT6_9BACI|nr:S-Ena type endospore appendage [Bacillus solimangrovi]OEH91558.1 DUF3992 domain-containing protein [Bacillus solimangrovi]